MQFNKQLFINFLILLFPDISVHFYIILPFSPTIIKKPVHENINSIHWQLHSIYSVDSVTWGNSIHRSEQKRIWGTKLQTNQYSNFPNTANNTHPQSKEKSFSSFFLTAGSGHHFPLCCSGHSLWDCVSLLTSSLVLLRLYPQLTAMSIGCISVQPSSVQVFERLPGDGEEPKRSQPPKRYISSACPPIGSNWTRCDIVSDLTGHCKQQTTAKKIKLCKVPQKVFPANVSRYWLVLYLSLQKGTLLLQILTDPYLAIHLTPHNDPGKNACTR